MPTFQLKETYPYYLANEAVFANTDLEVTDKYTGEVATRVAMADESTIDAAIGAADEAKEAMAAMPAHARQKVLEHCVARFTERQEEMAQALCIEAGKPIRDSRGEVTRLIDTFKIAAEEAVRIEGEVMPLDRTPRTTGYTAFWKRVPIGPCSFISPFNFPLNLAAHKVAPALAMGCPFVLKPASQTPLGALIIGEVLAETDLPKGAFSILPCRRDGAALFTEDDRFKLLSFTGSPGVGWALKAKAGKKTVILELGGNAACVVDADAPCETCGATRPTGLFRARSVVSGVRSDSDRVAEVHALAALPAGGHAVAGALQTEAGGHRDAFVLSLDRFGRERWRWAVGAPDADRGQIVKAFVELSDGATAQDDIVSEMQDFVKSRISAFKYPRAIEFVEELPRTATGKLQRGALRQREREHAKIAEQ